jgi:Predicted oxidoreductases of the aldo/keto reductase family
MERRRFIQTAALSALGMMIGKADKLSAGETEVRITTTGLKKELGKTGFNIFPVVYGGIVSMRDGQPASDNYVSWAVDRGINYFDVAPSYEDAQEKLGNSLIPYRKNIYLACKTGRRMKAEAETEFEKSLELLHTDYFDVYQMHAMSSQKDIDQAFGPGGVMEMMVREKQEGRIRKLGFTAHSEEVAIQAIDLYDFDTVMFPINWMMNMHNNMGTALCKQAKAKGIGILAIKPLIHRHWKDNTEREASIYPKAWCKPIDTGTDKELAIAAIKYTFQSGPDVIIPPGDFKSFSFAVDHIDEILNNPLTRNEKTLLEKEYNEVKEYPFF